MILFDMVIFGFACAALRLAVPKIIDIVADVSFYLTR